MNNMRAVPPGEIVKTELQTLGLSANKLAKMLGVPTNRITSIIKNQRSITADTALRLAKFFGTTAEFWMNLQTAYDLKIARKEIGKKINREVQDKDVA